MKHRLLLALAASAVAVCLRAGAADGGPPRMLPLLTIAELGSLSWSCDSRGGAEIVRLRADRVNATETVRIRVGSVLRTFTLQPGESASVRADGARAMQIEIAQGTEARTLRALISLSFPGPGLRSYCYPYFPPTVTLTLHY